MWQSIDKNSARYDNVTLIPFGLQLGLRIGPNPTYGSKLKFSLSEYFNFLFAYLVLTYYSLQFLSKAKKKYMCVYCHMSKKSRVGRSGLLLLFFFLLSAKPEIVVPCSGIRFRYFIFEISGKMTNYAVFLPSLLSISTKS